MPMDQVAWASANVTVGGHSTPYARGALLPAATSDEEAAERSLLRLIGALRPVEVAYTQEEVNELVAARAQATAQREAAAPVDTSVPLAQQAAGTAAGPPALADPSGAPVVIGDEDLRAAHDQADADAAERRAALTRRPSAGASRQAWQEYAVNEKGADPSAVEGMTRDQLRDTYGG